MTMTHLLFSALFLMGLPAFSNPLAVTAYGRTADISAVKTLASLQDLELIVAEMQKSYLKIYKVPADIQSPQVFDFLPLAPVAELTDLAEKVADVGSEGALFVTQDEVRGASTNFILIANNAQAMTLFHEYIHHLFESQNRSETAKITKHQQQEESLLRRFNFKASKVMFDRSLLMSKLWRDEIKEVSEEYVDAIAAGQGAIAAEEVATETALTELLVLMKSPHFNLQRAQFGINVYSAGLAAHSESLVMHIVALNDIVFTDGIDLDPQATKFERTDWERRSKLAKIKIDAYLNGPVARMKEQVESAQKLLQSLVQKN